MTKIGVTAQNDLAISLIEKQNMCNTYISLFTHNLYTRTFFFIITIGHLARYEHAFCSLGQKFETFLNLWNNKTFSFLIRISNIWRKWLHVRPRKIVVKYLDKKWNSIFNEFKKCSKLWAETVGPDPKLCCDVFRYDMTRRLNSLFKMFSRELIAEIV